MNTQACSSGITYQNRVVLRPSRQDSHDSENLLLSPNDGVQLSISRLLRHIDGVFRQRLGLGGFFVFAINALRTPHGLYGIVQQVDLWDTRLVQQSLDRRVLSESRNEMILRDIAVSLGLLELLGLPQDLAERRRE